MDTEMATGMYFTQPLHRALQQFPGKVALICGSRTVTFDQLAYRVSRLASALVDLGMRDGDRVAMLALNSDRYFEYLIGAVWGGGSINPCNTRWSVAELVYAIEDSASKILLVDDRFLETAIELKAKCATLETLVYVGDGPAPVGLHPYEELIAAASPMADRRRGGEDLLGLFYTGGTTGSPKGVTLSHANFLWATLAFIGAGLLTEDGVFLHAAPMFHLGDLVPASVAWVMGNAHSFVPSFSPQGVVEAIERDKVTDVVLVPTMVQMLVDDPVMATPRDLTSLRKIVYASSPMPEGVLERALKVFEHAEFIQAYGMTELVAAATLLPGRYHTPEGRKLGKLRSAGRTFGCTELRIADPAGEDVAIGQVGEIVVRGPMVMRGYWNKPELTAKTVRDGWMHTGDAGYLDGDGFLFVVDRVKDMIISGGENIYSAEVEDALSTHPAVQSCAVIGIPHEKWGETVHAFVVLKAGGVATQEQLVVHCRTLIAGYKCPRSVDMISTMPLSAAGKILKSDLRKPFWADRERMI
jgi:acyl-CoA synthetase (AMP-forming)/AMP-acid ligase II